MMILSCGKERELKHSQIPTFHKPLELIKGICAFYYNTNTGNKEYTIFPIIHSLLLVPFCQSEGDVQAMKM